MEEKKTLRDLVYDLDWNIGGISCRLETFNDISVMLEHLKQEMEEKGEQQAMYYFREWFRKIRILNELMRYTLSDFSSEHETMEAIREEMFKRVVTDETVLEKGQRPSINSLDGWSYFGMDSNIKLFTKEFGRMPESFEEVATHINKVSARVAAHEGK